ncbi:MAG: hypothetical protein KZQ91_05010 [Candidatus Thiodiazotropha sp. (ex Lucinoma borealis)]|nr:hypothetical protein [Candidatus Thiodiazotropha sp. (ex Lucinoma borealis)]
MDADKTLPDLTPDDRIWRLDWFGNVAYPGTVQRYAQPSLRVTLSPLLCDLSDNDTLLCPDCTEHHHTHEAWVPIASLPLLSIGDLWQHGRRQTSPDYRIERFETLRVNKESTTFVKAGLAIDEHFLLPLGRHPWHLRHTQSYCVVVTLPNSTRLIVPCMELIRFYFGSSGNLIQRLFTTPLVTNSLWAKKRYDNSNYHLHLVLADRMSGESAADIGRIAASKFAKRSAAGIHASCQKASAQKEPVYPYTGFPFEGKTDLVASGIWLPFGEQEDATFLIYRLRSCSHPFPFQSLSYEAADRKAWHRSHRNKKTDQRNHAIRSGKRSNQIVNTDPGSNKNQRSRKFKSTIRFPDLVQKSVWREKVEAMPAADIFLRHADGSLEQVAYGESEGNSNVAGVNATQAGKEKEGRLPRFVKIGLLIIETDPQHARPGTRVKLITPSERSKFVFSLPLIVDENGEMPECLLLTSPDGSMRPRRASFVEVTTQRNQKKHMLIIEGATWDTQPGILAITHPEMLVASISLTKQ